jgi:hypothetical protein
VRLAVSFAADPPRIDLISGAQRLLTGAWQHETTCDGEAVRIAGEWEELYWDSDATCEILELGVELSHGLRLERQILLARQDRVLYLADVVLAADDRARRLAHEMSLPLGPSVAWRPEADTRDGTLTAAAQQAAVLPLALHEWRSDPRGGSLAEAGGRLALKQEATGCGLYAPLLFDLDPRRARRERSWRQLTVAESLEVVPRDVAVAFRAQSGRNQWLFYRSLGPAGNRSFMGQNVAGEFYAGRFRPSGKVDEWIEVELCE